MSLIIGLDTSNYTTSTALFDGNTMLQRKKLLPVKAGSLGLKQSDAVFHHTQQLPELMEQLFAEMDRMPDGVAVSTRPREADGSYMPCFTVGAAMARGLAAALKIPMLPVSHQHGHIAAALYSCGRTDWIGTRFLAFHVSGGTTEALLVEPDAEKAFMPHLIASSLDLKAGQAIDRAGVMLGLPFPAGAQLDALAQQSNTVFHIRPTMRGCSCSLSGIENQCKKMQEKGQPPAEIAAYCIQAVGAALDGMTAAIFAEYGRLPLIFAGGVTSNSWIRRKLSEKYNALFADPVYSCDNAAGVAYLGWRKMI